jgi:hypothetical protein
MKRRLSAWFRDADYESGEGLERKVAKYYAVSKRLVKFDKFAARLSKQP